MTTATENPVIDLGKARKTKKAKAKAMVEEFAPFEAFAPTTLQLQGDDWQIVGCDGDQHYVWIASKGKGRKTYRVEEVYPARLKRSTRIRTLEGDDPAVLPIRCETIEATLAALKEELFEDMVMENA
jgi:hypothetical protein